MPINQYKILSPVNCKELILLDSTILPAFSEAVMNFIEAFSSRILKDIYLKQFPEIIALAFWMRKANIIKLKNIFDNNREPYLSLGRGIVFHITPSNVDTIFVYSWFLSMLAGNINIIRISSKLSNQMESLINIINEIITGNEFIDIKNRYIIIQYEHNDEITGYFSSLCNVRVIWGGDETISKIRSIPVEPTAKEITFADKFSFSIIEANRFLECDNKDMVTTHFYNDSFTFAQNACSSPRLIFWSGDEIAVNEARNLFWSMLEQKVIKGKQGMPVAMFVDKLVAALSLSIISKHSIIERGVTNMITRIFFNNLDDIKRNIHCGGGLFYEARVNHISEISEFITRKDQTISVFGFDREELIDFVIKGNLKGIDRIVPVGKSLDFSNIWDGYDLLQEFSRKIEIL